MRFSTKYTDGETALAYYGYRYYAGPSGRWISRDPAEENGGRNPYAMVDGNPIAFTDSLGLWKWKGAKRDGHDRATVIAERCGDPYEELAMLVHLDPADIKKWLEAWIPNDQVRKDDQFTVPNTVVITKNVGGPFYTLATMWAWWEYTYRKFDGYKVVGESAASAAHIKSHFTEKDVQGLVIISHGPGWDKGSLLGDDFAVLSPDEVTTHHRLGGVKLVVCYAGVRGTEWRAHVSPSGYFWATPDAIGMSWFLYGGVPHDF